MHATDSTVSLFSPRLAVFRTRDATHCLAARATPTPSAMDRMRSTTAPQLRLRVWWMAFAQFPIAHARTDPIVGSLGRDSTCTDSTPISTRILTRATGFM